MVESREIEQASGNISGRRIVAGILALATVVAGLTVAANAWAQAAPAASREAGYHLDEGGSLAEGYEARSGVAAIARMVRAESMNER